MSLEGEFETLDFDISHLVPKIKSLCEEKIAIKRRDNFWTLGMATYKDGYNDLDPHLVGWSNFILKEVFGQMYKDQLEILSDALKCKVQYMKGMPLPGFHVFKYCKEFEQPLARPHVDVPFNKYDWGSAIQLGHIFTHVVPAEIPDGAGMYVWDLEAKDMAQFGAEAVVAKARSTAPKHFVEYEIGKMVVHEGKFVHQIKPFRSTTDKWRITLQSHAVLYEGSWHLYW